MTPMPKCKPPRQRHCWVPIPDDENFDDFEYLGEWLDICLGCGAVSESEDRGWRNNRPTRTFLYYSEADYQKAIAHYRPVSTGRARKRRKEK